MENHDRRCLFQTGHLRERGRFRVVSDGSGLARGMFVSLCVSGGLGEGRENVL